MLPENQSDSPIDNSTLFGVDRKWWVLIAIGFSSLMSALDISAVNTILPIINQSLESNIATIEWVVIIYLLIVSGLLPIFGRLGDLFGHKPIYLSGFFVFLSGTILCGFSPTVAALILFRSIQAVGAAMFSSNSPAILTKTFPTSQRGQVLGMQATMTYLGLIAGPLLAGWLTEIHGWQSIFFINIPICLIALVLSYYTIVHKKPTRIPVSFDFLGAFTFMIGLTCLLLGLNQGHNLGWTSLAVILLATISLLSLIGFYHIEKRTSNPVIDLELFKHRVFSSTVISGIINYICVFSISFLMPFYLIQGRQFSPSEAGIILTIQPTIMAVTAPISGTISDHFGTRFPCVFGMTVLTSALVLMSQLGPNSQPAFIYTSLALSGLGVGIFLSPNNSALMGSAPKNRKGIAAGIMASARNVGMVVGIGLTGAILTSLVANGSGINDQSLFSAINISFIAVSGIGFMGIFSSYLQKN